MFANLLHRLTGREGILQIVLALSAWYALWVAFGFWSWLWVLVFICWLAYSDENPAGLFPADTLKRYRIHVLAIAIAVFWCIYVWPTPWRYYKSGSTNYRVNRFTGVTQTLNSAGWHQRRE